MATFQDALESKLADKVQAVVTDLNAVLMGEPFRVPVQWFPLAVIFIRREEPADDEGYAPQETGVEHWAYAGYVSIEVVAPDAPDMNVDAQKRGKVPSYEQVKSRMDAVRKELNAWALTIDADPVVFEAGLPTEERSVQLVLGARTTGHEDRGDSFTQRALLEFTVFSVRLR